MASGPEALLGLLLAIAALAPAAWTLWSRRLLARAARRSARGHLKQGLTVALTASVATAVVAGALVVGDSMEALVEATATDALPGIDGLLRASRPMETGYFTPLISSPFWKDNVDKEAMLLTVPAAVTSQRSGQRDGQVTLYGFDNGLYSMSSFRKGERDLQAPVSTGEVAINNHLAEEASVREGDTITLRVPNPGFWGDFLFRFGEDASVESTYRVTYIFDDEGLGRLDLEAKRTATSAVFMRLGEAQDLMGVGSAVNTVAFQYRHRDIVGTDREERVLEGIEERLDAFVGASGIELIIQPSPQGWDVLASDLIFLQGDLELRLSDNTQFWSPTLTYFVDSLNGPGSEDLAYSTVSGIDFDRDRNAFGDWNWYTSSPRDEPGQGSLGALVNNWTADALGVDTITVGYTVVDGRYELVERTVDLEVTGIVYLTGKAYDPSLLPPIPGVHDSVSCLAWDPPFPIDLQEIEDEDVEYWNLYAGSPKVWIDLETARELWANPDGDWTTARFGPTGGFGNATLSQFDEAVTAADAGIAIVPARARALDTAGPLAIFEQMFLFFGLVLLLAGCLLEASAFNNLARSRLREHATLRALGLDRDGLVRVMLLEGTVWGGLAALIGVAAGAGLGAALVGGLNSVWADAVEGATIPLLVTGGSLMLALGLGLLVTVATLFLTARKTARAPIAAALSDRGGAVVETGTPMSPGRMRLLGLLLLIAPAAVGAFLRPGTDIGGIALFFSVGTLATVGAVLLLLPLARRLEARVAYGGLIAPWRMGLRSLNRRPGRTMVLVVTFSLVTFSVVGISWAGEIEIRHAGELRTGMTGGYDVLAETWVPVGGDLRDDPAAPPGDWQVRSVKVVGTEGGTCSNLNAIFPPRIMGVPHEFIEEVEVGFRSSSVGGDRETWRSLEALTDEGRVPVVVDYNTLVWIYGGELGDVYKVDGDRGRIHEFEVVGVMETSIFGGSFLTGVDLASGVYPDSAAYTYFLFRSGSKGAGELAEELETAFGDLGLDARTTEEVVVETLGYELSFLRLFQAYLALGLVVGALGLGALALREVRDRRREIGAMRAIGWPKMKVMLTFLAEHMWIAGAGVVAGVVGAAVSIVATSPGWLGSISAIYFPGGTVGLVLLSVVLAAAVGAFAAARDAARIDAVEALRSVE